jgi:hypothetical protein
MVGKTLKVEQLLVSADTTVTCPKCEHEFSLEEGFAKKALESLEVKSDKALAAIREAERSDVEKRAQEIAAQRDQSSKEELKTLKQLMADQAAAHAKTVAEMQAMTEQAFKPQIDALKGQLAESQSKLSAMDQREAALQSREQGLAAQVEAGAAKRAAELLAAEREANEKRFAAQASKVRTLEAEQLSLRQERQALQDEKAGMALEVQRQVDVRLGDRDVQIRTQEQEKSRLEKAELQKKLDDAVARLADAQRQMEQGSQQLQGEVLELAIEEELRRAFPLDTIEEVKKGQRGGDILQHVVTRAGQEAGIILWETKRAKDWQAPWIVKLKEDMRISGAAVGILVTMPGTLPKDWPAEARFAPYEEVWVTQKSTALGLADALREGLIGIHKQRVASAGKGEKMEALYDYLTSPQFAQKIKAVYHAFEGMQEDLQKERNAAEQRFARREKQIQSGMKELLGFAGDVQGLSHQELPMLELEPAPVLQSEEPT